MTSVPWLDAGQFGRNAGHLQGLTVKAELTDSVHFSGAKQAFEKSFVEHIGHFGQMTSF